MIITFDTEFIDNGSKIELISIGLVRADGNEYYAESSEVDLTKACPWVKEHVISKLTGKKKPRQEIAANIAEFTCGFKPEFWGYFPAYDWVALSQLYGRMLDVPTSWPNRPNDIAQWDAHLRRFGMAADFNKAGANHNALNDARWTMDIVRQLQMNEKLIRESM